jgi:ssDNA-binding Zn-finger/Zn-ribbon topoisomerase 1
MADKECAHAGLPPTGVPCPSCKQGTLEVARGRFGPIYKCTSEGCDYWLPERPTGKRCSFMRDGKKCGALMVMGTKTIPERCSDKTCPNRNPHKLRASA